jgi:hypothetical protein
MKILAIDPGPVESAWLVFESESQTIGPRAKQGNEGVLRIVRSFGAHETVERLVIEKVASYGMSVGQDIFETVFWSGRFAQIWGAEFERLTPS